LCRFCFQSISLSPKEEGSFNMDTQQVAMEKLWDKIEKLKAMVNRKHKRGRGSSGSCTNKVDNDIEAFYQPSHERRETRSHKSKHEEKIFKHNVRFPKFSSDLDPNVYEEWGRKVNQIVYSCDFGDKEILKPLVLEFEGYALFRWNKYQKDIIVDEHSQINSWKDLQKA